MALADFIVLNKKDLVQQPQLNSVLAAIKSINQCAQVEVTEYCRYRLNDQFILRLLLVSLDKLRKNGEEVISVQA